MIDGLARGSFDRSPYHRSHLCLVEVAILLREPADHIDHMARTVFGHVVVTFGGDFAVEIDLTFENIDDEPEIVHITQGRFDVPILELFELK